MTLIPRHGDSRGVALIIIFVVFWTIAALAVAARIWARSLKKVPFVASDYAIFIALFFGTALVGATMTGVIAGGLGQHARGLNSSQFVLQIKISFTAEFLWGFANLAIKISILQLFKELFWTKRFVRIACSTVTVFAALLSILIVLSAFLVCRPLALLWDPTLQGTCGSQTGVLLSHAIINLAIDLAVVIIPIPVLWKLQMHTSKKISIYFMFSLGIAICIITAIRAHSIYIIDASDVTYTAVQFAAYTNLEVLLGITNACLPVIRPALQKLFPASYSTWTSKGSKGDTPTPGENLRKADFRPWQERYFELEKLPDGGWGRLLGGRGKGGLEAQEVSGGDRGSTIPENTIRVTRGWDIS